MRPPSSTASAAFAASGSRTFEDSMAPAVARNQSRRVVWSKVKEQTIVVCSKKNNVKIFKIPRAECVLIILFTN